DHEIAGQGQIGAGTGRHTGHLGDRGQAQLPHGQHATVGHRDPVRQRIEVVQKTADVGPATERATRPGHHQHTVAASCVDPSEDLVEPIPHRVGHRVAFVGAVERDLDDSLTPYHVDVHRTPSP